MAPGSGRMLHHTENCLILLVVDGVEVDCFRPHLVLLASTHELRDQETLGISTDVVHQPLWRVLGKENSQVSVNTVVGSLKTLSDLEQ